jgi:hypothetical protein
LKIYTDETDIFNPDFAVCVGSSVALQAQDGGRFPLLRERIAQAKLREIQKNNEPWRINFCPFPSDLSEV